MGALVVSSLLSACCLQNIRQSSHRLSTNLSEQEAPSWGNTYWEGIPDVHKESPVSGERGDSSNRALNTNGSVEALHRGPAALQTSANGHGDRDAGILAGHFPEERSSTNQEV